MKKILSILFIFITLNSYGNVPFPEDVYQVKQIMDLLRKPLITKLIQMRQSFIEEPSNNYTRFFSAKETKCESGDVVPARGNVLQMIYNKKIVNTKEAINQVPVQESTEVINYIGCKQAINFTEIITKRGLNLVTNSWDSAMKGELNFPIKLNESETNYRMFDGNNRELFRLRQRKTNGRLTVDIFILNNKSMQIDTLYTAEKSDMMIYFHPLRIEYTYNDHRIRYNYLDQVLNMHVIALKKYDQMMYFDGNNLRIPFATYVDYFSTVFINNSGRIMGMLLDAMMHDLPPTTFVNAGSANSRLLEELRNAQSWLLQRTNLDQLRVIIEGYIQAVQSNQLQDFRPSKAAKAEAAESVESAKFTVPTEKSK